ncbi:MAG: ADP-ribosylglycohydrolase family protein [Proteocatella sp.]
MKRAYEYDYELITNAKPVVLSEDEQTWEEAFEVDERNWQYVKLLWGSNVPGSFAPERVLLAGIQSMYNMGYDVTEAEKLIPKALEYRETENKIELTRLTSKVFNILNNAPKIEGHPFWKYECYDSFEKYEKNVKFYDYGDKSKEVISDSKNFFDKTYAGWLAQIVGAGVGTAIEGYTTSNIKEAFGDINDYVRKPSTYNDDITYEVAFLEAFRKNGYKLKPEDIALEWVALIPSGWSAEDIALKNIMLGIYPPESGYRSNPFREWIGAQMRGTVCGMVAPANPKLAAELAFKDGVVSHHNNGVIGEMFNAMMCSMAYVEDDMRTIVKKAIDMVPKNSEYYAVVKFALDACMSKGNFEEAWKLCEIQFKEYNWIHAYPNAAAEVVALYFSENNFNKCINLISMAGQDVDCNAAQIMTLFGIAYGIECIEAKWKTPIGEDIMSYVRGYEKTSITEITKLVVDSVKEYN